MIPSADFVYHPSIDNRVKCKILFTVFFFFLHVNNKVRGLAGRHGHDVTVASRAGWPEGLDESVSVVKCCVHA